MDPAIATPAVRAMVELADDALARGQYVTINAVGTRGFIQVKAIGFEGEGEAELIRVTGGPGEHQDAVLRFPAAALLAIGEKEPGIDDA